MAKAEAFVLFFVFKEFGKSFKLKIHGDAALELFKNAIKLQSIFLTGTQRHTQGCKKVGIFGVYNIFLAELQGADKGLFKLRQEVERAAQKCHAAANGLAAGKAGYGLVYNGLENGGCQVGSGGAVINKGLNIALGKNAASGGYGVDFLIVRSSGIEALGIGLQKRCHLVYERACAAGANAVHALFKSAAEVYYLGVLAAQLYGNIGLGSNMLQGIGHRHNLLAKLYVQSLAEVNRAGAGYLYFQNAVAKALFNLLQKTAKGLLSVGSMASVLAIDHLALRVYQNQLNGGGAYIYSRAVSKHNVSSKTWAKAIKWIKVELN